MKDLIQGRARSLLMCIARFFVAGVLAVSLCLTASCGSQATNVPTTNPRSTSSLRVLALFPTDAPVVSGMNSANHWSVLGQDLKKAVASHIPRAHVTVEQSAHISDQIKALRDNQADHDLQLRRGDVLFVTPAVDVEDSAKGFGNMVGDRITSRSASENSSVSSSQSEDSDGSDDPETDSSDMADQTTLASQLTHLEKSGVHVVLCARRIRGYRLSMFIETMSPYEVGRLQAQQVASKIKLSEATPRNPRRMIILAPGSVDDAVSHEFIHGVWSVVGPSLSDGKAVLVGADHITTESDFFLSDQTSSFFLNGSNAAGVQRAVNEIIDQQMKAEHQSSSPLNVIPGLPHQTTPIDAVIAGTDFAAQQTVAVATNRGYTGSAATINPDVSLQSVVNNLAGNHDLAKKKVPDPRHLANHSEQHDHSSAATWPVISGFGGYSASVSLVTSGKQWITAVVDEKALSLSLAQMCHNAAVRKTITSQLHTHSEGSPKAPVQVLRARIVTVTSENIKRDLLDPGYASAADAGL